MVIMWKSKDDFVKDLACLNVFGKSDDREPYNIFHRSEMNTQAQDPAKIIEFIDPRTGETITPNSILEDDNTRKHCIGRGSSAEISAWTDFQLEKQLRMARTSESSNKAIERHYQKNADMQLLSKNKTGECQDSGNMENNTTLDNNFSNFPEIRVKGKRNSRTAKNVLISNTKSFVKD